MAELIVALDFADPKDLLHCAHSLAGTLNWCKVGLEAFVRTGPSLLARLGDMGYRVFLDLKFHDIPNTVGAAVRSATAAGAGIVTIHTQGGEQMARAAMEAAADEAAKTGRPRPLVYGVTILTSFASGTIPLIEDEPSDAAMKLARMAGGWGLDGVVCSGREAALIKKETGLGVLCPGIRPAGSSADDQVRVVTPAAAVRDGADFLVVGRPITRAADPVETARAILDEMAKA